MTDTIDISILRLIFIYIAVFFPLLLLLREGVNIIKDSLSAILRMSIQLGLVGLYLTLLFRLNNIWLNILWLVVMLTVATATTLKRANLKSKCFFIPIFTGTFIGVSGTIAFFIIAVVRPQPLFDARYLIPLGGMIMGNSLTANILSLERFYTGIREDRKTFNTYLMLGADLKEASRPYIVRALKSSISPTIARISTIGLVALPGMMTGQILGGSVPLSAIKYQAAIMIAIFIGETISAVLNLRLSMKYAFNDYSILKDNIFRTG